MRAGVRAGVVLAALALVAGAGISGCEMPVTAGEWQHDAACRSAAEKIATGIDQLQRTELTTIDARLDDDLWLTVGRTMFGLDLAPLAGLVTQWEGVTVARALVTWQEAETELNALCK